MSFISKKGQVSIQSNLAEERQVSYWSVITAYGLAAAEGIKLREEHFKVIKLLRAKYQHSRPLDTKKKIFNHLEVSFAAQGGRDFLYKLFPRDPVKQSMRIAGLSNGG